MSLNPMDAVDARYATENRTAGRGSQSATSNTNKHIQTPIRRVSPLALALAVPVLGMALLAGGMG